MARKQLTDRAIGALKPAKKGTRYDLMDSIVPGFGVRVTEKGKRTYILVARFPGSANPTRRAIAEAGAISLEKARGRARDWLELIRKGIDPAAEEERQRLAEAVRQENSFAAVAEDFLRLAVIGPDRTKPRQRKGLEVERDLRREFIGRWAKRPITDITAHDVLAVLDEAVSRGAAYQAHNLLGCIRRLFNWAIARGAYGLERSPCDRMKPKDVIGRKALRTRTLQDDEILAEWRAARRLGYPFGPLFQLLLLTGKRRDEVANASWSEFHPNLDRILRKHAQDRKPIKWPEVPADWKIWTIPAARMKGEEGEARAHVEPLSNSALEILAALPRFTKGDFLFSTTFGEKPVSGFSKAKDRLDRQMILTLRALARARGDDVAKVKLEPFVLHDLRRTMRTALSSLPIADMVRELVIAHVKPGLHQVYDQYAYLPEKGHALELWAGRLMKIVHPPPSNVVHFAASA